MARGTHVLSDLSPDSCAGLRLPSPDLSLSLRSETLPHLTLLLD